MKMTLKIICILLILMLLLVLSCLLYYLLATKNCKLSTATLEPTDSCIQIFDNENKQIAELALNAANKRIHLQTLPRHIPNSFIVAEDKKFYTHNGIDYRGIVRAIYKNIQARSFKQGASTISQQLVKNTQLTNEKTVKRKLKEFKLTRQLEKRYAKEEILEMYLNSIYFGHACYGIESASEYYFDKQAKDLSLAESAILASIIRSPSRYSPFLQPEQCLALRNNILKRMLDNQYCTEQEYTAALAENLPTKQKDTLPNASYLNAVYDELENLPLSSPYKLLHGCKIYTYLNCNLQQELENIAAGYLPKIGKSLLVTDNKQVGVTAFYSTEGNIARQAGSIMKPLAVYGPALAEGQISPATIIQDEKTDFSGYTPSNYKDKYYGSVSCRFALANSLNIPAVKILQNMGIENTIKYLRRMGLRIENEDKNLALALGGTASGYTLTELAAAYAQLANGGKYNSLHFISKIEDKNNNMLYQRSLENIQVFSSEVASILTDMLQTSVSIGTAKSLQSLPFRVATKTGTCGNESGNTDAYTLSYTTEHTIAVWFGNRDNTLTNIYGGGIPCHVARDIYDTLYQNSTPTPFQLDAKVISCKLDKTAYDEDGQLRLATPNTPKAYILTELFLKNNVPKEYGWRFNTPIVQSSIFMKDGKVVIQLKDYPYYQYRIEKSWDKHREILAQDFQKSEYIDSDILANTRYTYTVTAYFYDDKGHKITSVETVLPAVHTAQPNVKIPDKWWQ